ncbi:MAG: hypothetical protein ABIV48_12710 [Pyrinomonadaceae bacterium]
MTMPKSINIKAMKGQIDKAMLDRIVVCDQLLSNIKAKRDELESLHRSLTDLEPELVYRFYHQSFKVFWFMKRVESAKSLFTEFAPDGKTLNPWFFQIVDGAINAEFNDEITNKNWLAETRPILEALWHCKFFVEQMLSAADTLDKTPMTLPYNWAAVLYLYNLR